MKIIKTEEEAKECIQSLLNYIGEDPQRSGLIETPRRIANMWKEIFRGYDLKQRPNITTFMNGSDGITYDNMVIDSGSFYSMCEHHALPFFGQYYFAYIPRPNGRIIGLSKIARMVDYHAAKLQIQERLGREILDDIAHSLCEGLPADQHPYGLAICMEAEHLCKTMRGVKKQGKMKTSYLTGVFKKDAKVRKEFYDLISHL